MAHFACSVRAMTPDTSGVEALVPVKSSIHWPLRVVVVYKMAESISMHWDIVLKSSQGMYNGLQSDCKCSRYHQHLGRYLSCS